LDAGGRAWQRLLRAIAGVPGIAFDLLIVAILIILGLINQLGSSPAPGFVKADQLVHGAVIVAGILPLLASRRSPFAAFLAMAIVAGVSGSIGPVLSLNTSPAGAFALIFATYRAVAASGRRRGLQALAVALAAVTLVIRPWVPEIPVQAWLPQYPAYFVAFVAGRAQRERVELARVLERRVVDMDAQRDRSHRLAVVEARTGLAHDLRDIVAVALHQMTARADAALDRLAQPGEDPGPALAEVEAAGRTALAEMRQLLGVLRRDGAVPELELEPDLRRLAALADAVLPRSVEARVTIDADPSNLPRGTAFTAFRIVEEALHNIREYSRASEVEVQILANVGELTIEIRDDGTSSALQERLRQRVGVLGMRERAAAFGGTLQAEPEARGSYVVRCRLPLSLAARREPPELATVASPAAEHTKQARLGPLSVAERVRIRLRGIAAVPWLADLVLVMVLSTTAVMELQLWSGLVGDVAPPNAFSSAAYVWAVTWAGLLMLRRRAPMLTTLAMTAFAFLQTYPFQFFTPVSDIWALMIAIYTVGTRKPWQPHAWVAALLGAIGLVSIQPIRPPFAAFLAISTINLLGAAYLGTVRGERTRLNEALEDRLVTLAEQRRAEVDLELRQDRLALAREMHDLVAHGLSLMVVQAGAARTVARSDPEGARRAIGAVLEVGRSTDRELDQLLELLGPRMSADLRPRSERDVQRLVSQSRQSGIDVGLHVCGSHLPTAGGSLELALYRIVQESITNVTKHAPASAVRVHVHYLPDRIAVRVLNDAPAVRPREGTSARAGQGLVGMRERVVMFGGRLEAEPTPSGGFRVSAMIPAGATA
jgi:signal transduction histidine kinase